MNPELTEEQRALLDKQNSRLVSEFEASKLEREAQRNWDLFYKRNETNFFKDRHWTTREFEEILAEEGVSCQTGGGDGVSETKKKILLEVGCGVGNLAFPLIEERLPLFIFCCDFSARAVQFVKNNPLYQEENIRAFQCDITTEKLLEEVGAESVDIITSIFVLSAIHPEKHTQVLRNLAAVLRPGGVLLFRDYGRYDMAQIRFKSGSKIAENLYRRQDGTRSYFFTRDEVRRLGEQVGLEAYQDQMVESRTVNIKEGVDVPRNFVQAKFRKK